MKKLSIIFLLSGLVAFTAQAQENKERQDNYPYWTITKGVQRMQFNNVTFLPAKITTGNAGWVTSKGVHRAAATSEVASGTVAKTGYPSWVISKGVARQQFEKNNK